MIVFQYLWIDRSQKKVSRRNFFSELLDDSCSRGKIWVALQTLHFLHELASSRARRLPTLASLARARSKKLYRSTSRIWLWVNLQTVGGVGQTDSMLFKHCWIQVCEVAKRIQHVFDTCEQLKSWVNIIQHLLTGWSNAFNMLNSTMLALSLLIVAEVNIQENA